MGYIENHVCESDQRKVSLVGKESTCHELCKESTLMTTFKGIDDPKYNVDTILSSLDDLLEILSKRSISQEEE